MNPTVIITYLDSHGARQQKFFTGEEAPKALSTYSTNFAVGWPVGDGFLMVPNSRVLEVFVSEDLMPMLGVS